MLKRIIGILLTALMLALSPVSAFAKVYNVPVQERALIELVEVNGFEEPVIGGTFDAYALSVPEGAHYYIDYENTYWYWYGDEIPYADGYVYDGDTFETTEVTYYLAVRLIPDDGYNFGWNTEALIDGSEDYLDWPDYFEDEGYLVVYSINMFLTDVLTPINEVFIYGYESPVIGEQSSDHLDFIVPAGNVPYFVSHSGNNAPYWWNNDEYTVFNGAFEANTNYSAGITLIAKPGYYFTYDCKIYIEDEEGLADPSFTGVDQDDMGILYVRTLPETAADATQLIELVEVNGFEEPVIGGTFDAYALSVPEGAHYSIDYENTYWYWYGETFFSDGYIYDGDTFTATDATYYLAVRLIPDDGYTFDWNTEVLINGSEDYLDWPDYFENEGYLVVYSIDMYYEPADVPIPGDVNLNGSVTTDDAVLTIRYTLGLIEFTSEQLARADVNGNGDIDIDDALLILRLAMGLIEHF